MTWCNGNLEEMLQGYGFPPKFVQMIMICVTTTSYTIKVNGEGYSFFQGRRGLRQGDPFHPYCLSWLWSTYLKYSIKCPTFLILDTTQCERNNN